MMRNVNTGGFEIYDIGSNQVTSAYYIGAVGLDWEVAGFGPFNGAGTSDMVLRNKTTGTFEVYDIANNQLTTAANLGQVGLDWKLGGFAPYAATGSTGSYGGQPAADASGDISSYMDQLSTTTTSPPNGPINSYMDTLTTNVHSQLVSAMACFSPDAGAGIPQTSPWNHDTSQTPFLASSHTNA